VRKCGYGHNEKRRTRRIRRTSGWPGFSPALYLKLPTDRPACRVGWTAGGSSAEAKGILPRWARESRAWRRARLNPGETSPLAPATQEGTMFENLPGGRRRPGEGIDDHRPRRRKGGPEALSSPVAHRPVRGSESPSYGQPGRRRPNPNGRARWPPAPAPPRSPLSARTERGVWTAVDCCVFILKLFTIFTFNTFFFFYTGKAPKTCFGTRSWPALAAQPQTAVAFFRSMLTARGLDARRSPGWCPKGGPIGWKVGKVEQGLDGGFRDGTTRWTPGKGVHQDLARAALPNCYNVLSRPALSALRPRTTRKTPAAADEERGGSLPALVRGGPPGPGRVRPGSFTCPRLPHDFFHEGAERGGGEEGVGADPPLPNTLDFQVLTKRAALRFADQPPAPGLGEATERFLAV